MLQLLFWMSFLPLTTSQTQVSPHQGRGVCGSTSVWLCPVQQNTLWDVRAVTSENSPALKVTGEVAEGEETEM